MRIAGSIVESWKKVMGNICEKFTWRFADRLQTYFYIKRIFKQIN